VKQNFSHGATVTYLKVDGEWQEVEIKCSLRCLNWLTEGHVGQRCLKPDFAVAK